MAVWLLRCPDCEHRFQSLVMDGTRTPTVWVCGSCGSREAQAEGTVEGGPFSSASAGSSCGCGCG